MTKPRILIFSVAYEPLIGGAELAVRNITDRLCSPADGGASYEFDLITCRFSRSHKAHEKIGNVDVYRVGFGSRAGRYLYPAFAWRLARKLHLKNNYQIIWSIMAAYAGAAALMFLRRFPLPKYLLTLQEGDPIVHIHRRVRGFHKMWQRIFGRADYVAAISQYLGDWAKEEGAECPVEIVPNGVEIKNFQFPISNFQTNSKSQIFKIITTSRLVHKNGIDILIRAVAKLQATSYKLLILGSGVDENKLKKLAHELHVEDKIQFLGHIDPEEIPKYLSEADIFVRASRSEGLGSSFLEAMAAGLPVIGTAVGGIPEFLRDGETGLFSKIEDPEDLAEKIQLLLDDGALRHKLAENGKALIEKNYSWDHIASQMDGIFKRLTV